MVANIANMTVFYCLYRDGRKYRKHDDVFIVLTEMVANIVNMTEFVLS